MLAAAIKLLKACQEKLKCQTMGIDFSEGWKDQSAHFKVGFTSRRN
jgi:hypothetical protein